MCDLSVPALIRSQVRADIQCAGNREEGRKLGREEKPRQVGIDEVAVKERGKEEVTQGREPVLCSVIVPVAV